MQNSAFLARTIHHHHITLIFTLALYIIPQTRAATHTRADSDAVTALEPPPPMSRVPVPSPGMVGIMDGRPVGTSDGNEDGTSEGLSDGASDG